MCKTIYRYTIINDKEGKAGRILGSLKITYWKKEKCKKTDNDYNTKTRK